MQVVSGQPKYAPHRCAVLPYKNGVDSPSERFIDTGVDYQVVGQKNDERLYLSEQAVREMARILGHPTAPEHARAVAEVAAYRAENERLQEELREYDRRFEAIDVLESADFRARRKAGRPPKQKAA